MIIGFRCLALLFVLTDSVKEKVKHLRDAIPDISLEKEKSDVVGKMSEIIVLLNK